MPEIVDGTDAEIGYITIDIVSNQVIGPFILKPKAQDGRTFKCSSSTAVTLTAHKHGTADPYTSLVIGFDLSGETPGDFIAYDVKATGAVITGRQREHIFIGVVDTPGAAGWAD